jgi:outer membrane receptor protein involved in Fe transport
MNNEINYTADNWRVGLNSHYHSKMYIDQKNKYEIPEFLQFNIFGNYRYKNIEFGARVNNIFNRTNYINAAKTEYEDILWFRNAGTSVFGDIKFYF